jgi:ubiquinol-cytochrome c reductase iron-sulfur subunit
MAGRVFAGSPASINLGIPPHAFETETLLVIGVDPAATVQGAA